MHLPLPQDVIDQYEVGLPLTDNQIDLVERIHTRYEEEKKLFSFVSTALDRTKTICIETQSE